MPILHTDGLAPVSRTVAATLDLGPTETERLIADLHARLPPRLYRWVVYVVTAGASGLIAAVTIVVLSLYFRPDVAAVAVVAAAAAAFVVATVGVATWGSRETYRVLERWRAASVVTPRETVRTWELVTTFYLRQYRRNAWWVTVGCLVPSLAVAALVWGLSPAEVAASALAGLVPCGYGLVLSYSVGEALLRPVVAEVSAQLPDEFDLRPAGVSLTTRLRLALPTYTTMTGLTVAGIVGGSGGAGRLALTVLVSLAVGAFFSLELTNLLTLSVVRPLTDVRERLARVRAGDYATRSPVLSRDEIGELAHDFNRMARGLQERETIRETFGTYVDAEIVELILSEGFPHEGMDVDVSLLFVDVRSFTAYAEAASAAEVVASLNTLFTEIVPVIEGYGGHIDKFLGDGLLAVFGAPARLADHADRAVDAARMVVDVVAEGESGLRVAAGVNSGRVVAGPLGGAGRLNFSVIGDAVNVAARVEAATRQTGDDVLVTAATRDQLTRPRPLTARGGVELKGKSAPVEVFAPTATTAGASGA